MKAEELLKELNEDKDLKAVENIGKKIFGGCIDKIDFEDFKTKKGQFGTFFLKKNCDFIEVDTIIKMMKETKLDSIGVENNCFTVNFYTK